ncbi:MAG: hypothetical protein ONB13_09115, partial [candidate division KSB1 bacterium]|nr:hypothetical protein [candidate division KSB1 bacterium]
MKNSISLFILMIFLAAAVITGGCSKNSPTEPDQIGEGTELDQPYGGFTTSDELPAFGDASIEADFGDDEIVNDIISTDPSFANDLASNATKVYYVRIAWGLLQGDSTATDVVNWGGSATITRGKLGIMKTILFERNQNDHIVLPRSDRRTVQWVSNTVTHLDGILLVIVDKDTLNVPGAFTFTTSLYSKTFSFDELDSLQLVETVTPQGHQVSIQAYSKQIIRLGGGFVEGKWLKTREHGGVFRGRWIDEIGTRVGHIKGIWGINRLGEKVFFGKYISLNGQFGGILAGNWGN